MSLNFFDTCADNLVDSMYTVVQSSGGAVTETGGKLRILGSGAGWGQAGVVSNQESMGRCSIAVADVTIPASVGTDLLFGLVPSAALDYGAPGRFMVYFDNGTIRILRPDVNSTIISSGYTYAENTTYQVRVIRSSGWAICRIKGGAFADWTDLYRYNEGVSIAFYRVQAQSYRHDAAVVLKNIGGWSPGHRANFTDNFASLAYWNTAGTVSVGGNKVSITGNESWNANGMVSKRYVTGGKHTITWRVKTPASWGVAAGYLGGYSRSAALSYSSEPMMVYINNVVIVDNKSQLSVFIGTEQVTGYYVALSTQYYFRIVYDSVALSATVEIKGGAFADWTVVYTNNAIGKVATQYLQHQVYTANTYEVSEVVATQDMASIGNNLDSDLVVIGDSHVVYGVINSRIESFAGLMTCNMGISGNTTADVLARFQNDALSMGTGKVFVVAGTNDYNTDPPTPIDTIMANFTDMLTLANAAGVSIIVNEVPPVTSYPGLTMTTEQMQERTKLFNGARRKWCVDNAVSIATDYQDLCYNDPAHEDDIAVAYDSGDHLHLSTAGYNVVGDKENTSAIPSRLLRWGNAAYPSVNDEGWSWMLKSAGASVTGDANTGTLVLPQNETAAGPVKCLESGPKLVTITPTLLSGTVSVYYRTSASNFNRNAAAAWTLYAAPFIISDQFVQIKLVGTSVASANVDYVSMPWQKGVDPVTNLQAVPGDSRVSLSWDASADPDLLSYSIEWSTTPGFTPGTGTRIDNILINSYVHTGRNNWTPYYYYAYAVSVIGESAASNIATATPGTVVGGPALSKAETGKIRITWSAVEHATSYNLYMKQGGIASKDNFDGMFPMVTSPYDISSLDLTKSYSFVVTSNNLFGEGAESADVKFSVIGTGSSDQVGGAGRVF